MTLPSIASKRYYTNQLADQWLFVEQFGRWQALKLTDAQRNEVSRLSLQVAQLKTVNEGILKIVSAIEHATIDKIMAMEDGELALAVLSGKIKSL
jgi:predicted Fe-Mo cluster-binding NifX family protein